jgi:hypothetical protein
VSIAGSGPSGRGRLRCSGPAAGMGSTGCPGGQGHEGCLLPDTDDIPRRRRVLVLEVTQAASEVSRLIREARDLHLPVEPGVQGRAKRARPLGGSSRGGAAMTEPHKLTDLVPVEVLTEVNTAVAVGTRQARTRYRARLGGGLPAGFHIRPAEYAADRRRNG